MFYANFSFQKKQGFYRNSFILSI